MTGLVLVSTRNTLASPVPATSLTLTAIGFSIGAGALVHERMFALRLELVLPLSGWPDCRRNAAGDRYGNGRSRCCRTRAPYPQPNPAEIADHLDTLANIAPGGAMDVLRDEMIPRLKRRDHSRDRLHCRALIPDPKQCEPGGGTSARLVEKCLF